MHESAPTGVGRLVVSCPGCDEKYVVEISRIPPQGGKLTCRICGGRVHLPRHDSVASSPDQPSAPSETMEVASYGGDPEVPSAPALDATPDSLTGTASQEICCPHCSRWFAPHAAQQESAGASASSRAPGRRTILVVEDTEYFLQLAQDALGGRYRTVVARTPASAIQALRESAIDLLVLDLTLEKEEDGLVVLSEASRRHLPCLIFTAKGESEMWGDAWNRLRGLGATDLLLKGMNFEEQLVSKVDAMFAANVA